MIKNLRPMTMTEVSEQIKLAGAESEITGFVKKFNKLSIKEAEDLRSKVEGFNMIKLKDENIVKLVDLLPNDAEELNKILIDVSLDEDETKKLLDTIKEFK